MCVNLLVDYFINFKHTLAHYKYRSVYRLYRSLHESTLFVGVDANQHHRDQVLAKRNPTEAGLMDSK